MEESFMGNYEAIKVFEDYLMAWSIQWKKGKIQNLYTHRKKHQNVH